MQPTSPNEQQQQSGNTQRFDETTQRIMYTRSLLVVNIIVLLVLCSQFYTAEPKDDERKPSMFQVGDEWLALPEVFSNLDFQADSTPASEEDIEGQVRLRASRFWGRMYIDGWPQTIQFFRAHFGIEPPLGRKVFVFPDPRDACEDIKNPEFYTEDHVLLVNRGKCTFGAKAKNAQKTRASGIVIINNEPGIDHLPGPDAHDIHFSVCSIPQPEGQLLEAIYDEGPPDVGEDGTPGPGHVGLGRRLEGFIVPINCENGGAKCIPATYDERRQVANLTEGGYVRLSSSLKEGDLPVEYLLAHFGAKMLHSSMTVSAAVAKPVDACSPILNDIKGKAVLVRRGGCPFVKKAEEIQAAGGRAMVVGNHQPYIVRMGVEPRWKGLNTAIPVLMVSKRAYSILVAESYTGGVISFEESLGVNSAVWEPLEKLTNGEGWPRSDSYVAKRYEQLLEEHKAWPDRVASLKFAYTKKLNGTATDSVKSEL